MTAYSTYLVAAVMQLALLAQATDLLGGHCGRLGFGAVVAAGVAGYGYAVSIATTSLGPWTAFIVGLAAASLVSGPLTLLLLKLDPESYLLASFALQMTFVELVNNLEITGGPLGIRNVPAPAIGLFSQEAPIGSLAVLLPCVACASLVLTAALGTKGRLGRALHWIRDDPTSAGTSHLNVTRLFGSICLAHCLIAGTAGMGIVILQGYIAPRSFDLWLSLKVLTVVILSGTGGSPVMMVVGSAILVGLTELINAAVTAPEAVGPLQQILINSLLVVLLVWRKRGLAGPVLESGPSAERPE